MLIRCNIDNLTTLLIGFYQRSQMQGWERKSFKSYWLKQEIELFCTHLWKCTCNCKSAKRCSLDCSFSL